VLGVFGVGVAGFMKLPYKNTREFSLCEQQEEHYFPKNPKLVSL